MSKHAPRKATPRRHTTPHTAPSLSPEKQERAKRLILIAVIAVLAAIPFIMGKYFEFNSPCAFDGGAYVYSAKRVIDGAKIGIDEKPSAQMGTLLVNMLGVRLFGFSDTGPKLIQGLLQAAALVLMFVAVRKVLGTLSAGVAVIIASIYLSAPLMAKYGNVKEQHMIAFMIMGMSCFVLYQLNGKWWYVLLTGALLSWAPIFKETGTSALGAVGVFVIAQPLLKHCTWKKTGADILLLVAGAAIAIGPICLWLAASKAPINYYPYAFLYRPLVKTLQSPNTPGANQPAESEPAPSAAEVEKTDEKPGLLMKFLPAYVRDSWLIMTPEQRNQAKLRVFRWYGVLILPIALALGSIIIRIIRLILGRLNKSRKDGNGTGYDKFVLLFGVWWFLDMAYVWISPRSYEQYYLPLNASAAMLGGYMIAVYYEKLRNSAAKPKWIALGAAGLLLMAVMSLHIFRGVAKSPHSGAIYRTQGIPQRDKGYAQKLAEVHARRTSGSVGAWEVLAQYIRDNSTRDDVIYVWGWFPGIYVQAQRLSSAPKAFEGTMHTLSPTELSNRIDEILAAFEKRPPKFIVDSRKSHFPWDRPPLELWPQTQKGFLPAQEQVVSQYEAMYAKMLADNIKDADEVKRFEAMKPFRDYVMKNYKVVRMFGAHVLLQRK